MRSCTTSGVVLLPLYDLWSHPERPLLDHLESVAGHAEAFIRSLPSTVPHKDSLTTVARVVGLLHDYGKATPYFQKHLRGESVDSRLSRHAFSSAVTAFLNLDRWASTIGRDFAGILAVLGAVAVKRHHGNLGQIKYEFVMSPEDTDFIEAQLESIDSNFCSALHGLLEPYIPNPITNPHEIISHLPDVKKTYRSYLRKLRKSASPLDWFVLMQTLFSVLIDADKIDASRTTSPTRARIPDRFIEQHVAKITSTTGINKIRKTAFDEVLQTADKIDLSAKMMSLTLPTGLGKTFDVLAFAHRLRNRIITEEGYTPRIIYCLPFTSIIDQNYSVLSEILNNPPSTLLIKHHHLGDTIYRTSDDELDYDKSEILIEGWNSEIVVTTFVQLFFTLAGYRNRPLRRYHNLIGSIIILDEVQTIPPEYWLMFRSIATTMSELLSVRFILVTATQPGLFSRSSEIIASPKDYFTQLRRLSLEFDLNPISLDSFIAEIQDKIDGDVDSRILAILNTKRDAEEVYYALEDYLPSDHPLFFLSTSLVPAERIRRINEIRESGNSPAVLVSTQLIEAGVDLDFDIVYRDFAPLDSLIQSAGRCKRHSEVNSGTVIVRSIHDESEDGSLGRARAGYIYSPTLLDATRRILDGYGSPISDSDFYTVAQSYFMEVQNRISTDKSRDIIDGLRSLDYSILAEVRLIENRSWVDTDVFIELDDIAVDVLEKYRQLVENPSLSLFDRRREFMKFKKTFLNYVVTVQHSQVKGLPNIGNLYFVPSHDIDRCYDKQTGFRREPGAVIF